MKKRIPVVLDTDIGTDIDDTWALAMMLKCPELDVRLIVSDTDDTEYRAALICKLLEVAGRTDIPVGIGVRQKDTKGGQWGWVKDYRLDDYKGTLYRDGVQAICDTVRAAAEPVKLICIGPVPNIAAVLDRDPSIASKAHFVGMHGSIRVTTDGQPGPVAEYNVVRNPEACRRTFEAPWLSRTITPLDTCGVVRLDGERYRKVLNCREPLTRAVIENYRIWAEGDIKKRDPNLASSILFDTVAIHLAYTTRFLKMERMHLTVTPDGFTRPDPTGPALDVAIEWADLDAYADYLTERMLAPVVAR